MGSENGFVIAVVRQDAQWRVDRLPDGLTSDLDGIIRVLGQQVSDGGAIGFVDVADEFFVAVRVVAGGDVRLLLSDITAAVEWDLARQVLDKLGDEPPEDDEMDEVWPAGDLAIFAELGLGEMELAAILDDLDLYADEMLFAVARQLGFAEAYQVAVDARVR